MSDYTIDKIVSYVDRIEDERHEEDYGFLNGEFKTKENYDYINDIEQKGKIRMAL